MQVVHIRRHEASNTYTNYRATIESEPMRVMTLEHVPRKGERLLVEMSTDRVHFMTVLDVVHDYTDPRDPVVHVLADFGYLKGL